MPKPKVPPSERITTSFKELKSLSPDLRSAARELSNKVADLSDKLDTLDLGVAAWTDIAGGRSEENGYYWSRSIGYTKVAHRWEIALREKEGNYDDGEHSETVWKFSEAPHWPRWSPQNRPVKASQDKS